MVDRIQKLVQEILLGRKDLFAELIGEFERPIFSLALRMTGSSTKAADLSQEIFVRAWLNLDKYDPKKEFFTWLYTLSLNVIRNHLKKKTRSGSTLHLSLKPARPVNHPARIPPNCWPQSNRSNTCRSFCCA
jgi:DNA-directed RNA polymerase specialized sigma24 family protein